MLSTNPIFVRHYFPSPLSSQKTRVLSTGYSRECTDSNGSLRAPKMYQQMSSSVNSALFVMLPVCLINCLLPPTPNVWHSLHKEQVVIRMPLIQLVRRAACFYWP